MVRAGCISTSRIVVQYWDFLKQLVWHHNLGLLVLPPAAGHAPSSSRRSRSPCPWPSAPRSSGWCSGVLSGVLSAVRRGSFWDRPSTTLALFFYSMPTFVLGLLLLCIFYYQFTIHGLHGSPARGTPTSPRARSSGSEAWSCRGSRWPWSRRPTYTRLTRGSLLEVLGEDYIRTARAKGLTERRVIYRHGLRSALTPVVSQFGIDVGVRWSAGPSSPRRCSACRGSATPR